MKLINIEIGNYAKLTGYIHEPSNEMKNIHIYPGIVILPGGGFRICSDREAEPVAAAYFAEGYQVFVLCYTTVTAKPDAVIDDPMQDVQDALTWIRDHAATLYLDESKLAMLGFSGGAHLAAASATHGALRPNALLLGYPGILHSELRALECPDIIESIDERTPPTFLFVSREDKVTPPVHALTFTMELDRYGIDYELHIFKSGPHGMSLAKPITSSGVKEYVNPVFAQWFDMSIDWLKAQFGEFTIYGVNDGRFGRYSIDSTIQELFACEETRQIVLNTFPVLGQVDIQNPTHSGATLRTLLGYLPEKDETLIKQADEALLRVSGA